ncbi:MAG TPA: pyridoxamine 5'-phosphate oxidase family protein [Nocardioides sp.]|nr:pyridoxamine 5'-phosphate oxidase family protein [Nocardioides sp.]
MGKIHERIEGRLRTFVEAQPVFFVATSPLSGDGHINLSPRGIGGSFKVLDEHTVAWLDTNGSGSETIAHLRENGRITVMFCAFDGPPNIVRFHGRGRVVPLGTPEYDDLRPHFVDFPVDRAVIVVDVERISDTCGYGVPVMDYREDRTLLRQWSEKKGPEGAADYRREKNRVSIDGLPAYDFDPEPA